MIIPCPWKLPLRRADYSTHVGEADCCEVVDANGDHVVIDPETADYLVAAINAYDNDWPSC